MSDSANGIQIIGVDCAVDVSNVGLALGFFDGQSTKLQQVAAGSRQNSPLEIILNWLDVEQPVLLALDAPLGWPVHLGAALAQHQAGQPISTSPNQFFRRETDTFIHALVGKQPMDVGADRIARTAHAALKLLDELRIRTSQPISLAWDSHLDKGLYAIEVYPAATLRSYGFNPKQVPQGDNTIEQAILAVAAEHMLGTGSASISNRHAVDAVICVLAGADFLQGDAVPPVNLETAQKEGWIWTRDPKHL